MSRKIFTNIIYQFADRIITMVMNFSLVLILTRSLNLQTFGEYTFIQAYIFGFVTFTDLGINMIVLRELSAHRKPVQWIIERTFTLKLVVAFLVFTLAVASVYLLDYNSQLTNALFIYSCMLLLTAFDVIPNWFQAELKGRVIALIDSCSLGLGFVMTISIILIGGNLISLVSVLLVQVFIKYYLLYRSFRKQGMHLGFKFDFAYSWSVVRSALPLTITSLLTSFSTNTALVLLSKIGGAEQLAFYSAGSRFNTILLFMPQAVVMATFPVMVNLFNNYEVSRLSLVKLYTKLMSYLSLIAILLGVVTVFWAGPIISIIFGEKYIAGASVLQIIIWYVVVVYLGIPSGTMLIACEKQNLTAIAQGSGAIILLLASFVLVPMFKAAGLAMTMVVSLTLVGVMQTYYLQHYLKLKNNILQNFRFVILIIFLISFCWLTSSLPVLLAIPLTIVFYSCIVLLLRFVSFSDINSFRKRFNTRNEIATTSLTPIVINSIGTEVEEVLAEQNFVFQPELQNSTQENLFLP